jgi:hypothetical protein
MAHMQWTPEQMAVLRKLWAAGLSATAIMPRLGHAFSRNAILGKVDRMKLPKRMTTKTVGLGYWNKIDEAETERRKKIVAMVRSNGGTARHLANALRITVKHARFIAAKCGMPFGRPTGRAGGRKATGAPKDRKSIRGVSQPGWRVPVAVDALAYEAERRSNGAMTFVDIRNKTHGFCKWFLHGEAGKDGLQCCKRIPAGSPYCDHHRERGTTPYQPRQIRQAAE